MNDGVSSPSPDARLSKPAHRKPGEATLPTMLKKTDGALSPSMRRKAKRLLRTKVLTCRQIATGLGVPAQAVRALKAWEKRPRRSRVTPQPESETELLPVERKTGEEPFAYADGTPLGVRLRDFWVWANSELLCNALRGRLAEYIVACATRADTARCRREWEPFDVTTCEGIAVEVKSAAYVQAWCQPKATKPVFQIAKKRRLHKDGRWLGGVYPTSVHGVRLRSTGREGQAARRSVESRPVGFLRPLDGEAGRGTGRAEERVVEPAGTFECAACRVSRSARRR